MKIRVLTFFLFTFILWSFSFAQAITPVTPGDGTLAAAIAAAAPGDILQLTGGAEYTHSSSASFAILNKPITIQVEPGSTQKAIIKLADSVSAGSYYFFMMQNGASLTLRGLDIDGIAKTDTAKSLIKFDGKPTPAASKCGTIKIENCVIHDFADYLIHGNVQSTMQGMVNDSLIINNIVAHNAQTFLGYSYVSLGYFELKNSTIYKFSSLGIKIGNEPYRKTKITPTTFIDHCTFDNFGGTDPSMDYKGIIEVKDYYFPWTITNSIFSNFQDSTKTALNFKTPQTGAVTNVINTCQWRCGVPPYTMEPLWPGYAFHDTITMDPKYKGAANGDFTLPTNSPLLTFGSDGGPIGDPRWAKPATQVRQEHTIKPLNFQLSQNYPNPFNPRTKIEFQMSNSEFVTLKVFDVLGREVAILVNEVKPPAAYQVSWNAAQLPSGVYLYRLQAANFTQTRRMILTK